MNFSRSLLTITAAALSALPARAADEGRRIVGYFVEWGIYQRGYHVADVPADKLTHLNYAFARVTPDGECVLFDSFAAVDKAYPGDKWEPPGQLRGCFNQLLQLKKKHPHLKTLISVGGWTLSGPFSDVAASEKLREKFAKSCVAFVVKYGFDGVDVDWEYPVGGGLESNRTRPEDRQNFTLLLAALRRELDARGKLDRRPYLLTIAAPAGPKVIRNLEVEKIHRHLDWINLMTYDFHGAWSTLTNFNAPLYPSKDDPTPDEDVRKRFNVDAAAKAYLAAGVPAEKVVVGVPFYGRGWGGVKDVKDGLYQPHAPQPPKGTWEAGVFDYKDLAANHVGKTRRLWHDEARVPWLFDPKSGVMISYDDAESLKLKAEYVKAEGLGGVMFWELSADDSKGALLTTLADTLRPKK
jgi:chitinase